MRKTEFGIITAGMTVFVILFMLFSVWNTTFPLMEKGLYTIAYLLTPLLMVLTASLLAIYRKGTGAIPGWLVAVAGLGAVAISIIAIASVYNTTWDLRHKGLYWLGEITLIYCGLGVSMVLSKENEHTLN